MSPEQLLKTLQFSDSLFPVGAFAYSDGLETAVTNGLVKNRDDLEQWLDHYIKSVFIPCEGLLLRRAIKAHSAGDWETVARLDREFTALKPSAAVRASSASLARNFAKSVAAVHGHPEIERARRELANFATLYAVVVSTLGLDTRDALLAFAYSRLAGTVSAALRLMRIGQQQAQQALGRALGYVPEAVERIFEAGDSDLQSFSPLLDIQQMNHRYVYSRLFRS
jgi:urease accessory protein